MIFGIGSANGGTAGVIPWRVATQRFVPFASVFPSRLLLRPGQSRTVTVSATTPSSPGDASGSIVLRSDFGLGGSTSIPVTLRSLVQVASHRPGSFSGVLTGGNGRANGKGQQQYYEFNVPAGVRDISADVSIANDPTDPVGAYLIAPDGEALGYGQNSLNGTALTTLTANTLNPVPGDVDLDRGLRRAGRRERDLRAVHRQRPLQRRERQRSRAAQQRGHDAPGGEAGDGSGDDHQHRNRARGLLRRPTVERDDVADPRAVRGDEPHLAADDGWVPGLVRPV